MTYQCYEVCKHDHRDEEKVEGCKSKHKSIQAAAKHGKSEFFPYFSSNQPWSQVRLEVRDEAGCVVKTFRHETKFGRSIYARWVEVPGAAS